MKKLLVFLLLIMMISIMAFSGVACSFGGDGKSSCKNCGRSSVYALGFCKSCYKSFHDYTYGD